jgi:RNA polymerase sigma-70 factor (ECF subfamily)
MCCHPALDAEVRVALTLRSVCGLRTGQIAAAFLVSEQAMAQRLVRAKRKIAGAGIRMGVPDTADLPARLNGVLRVVYLVFTEGHRATSGDELIRGELCDQAIGLARGLAGLLPDEPEVTGLLALLLLTDARREARTDADGALVLLPDQDRRRWDRAMIAEGEQLLEQALQARRPGPYQLHAAVAACHSAAASAAATDWPQIAALYQELLAYEPTPVTEANRAVAVAMAGGPEAGLEILAAAGAHPRLAAWPQLHIARAELLRLLGRHDEALAAYQAALAAGPPRCRAGPHRAPDHRAHLRLNPREQPAGEPSARPRNGTPSAAIAPSADSAYVTKWLRCRGLRCSHAVRRRWPCSIRIPRSCWPQRRPSCSAWREHRAAVRCTGSPTWPRARCLRVPARPRRSGVMASRSR